VTLPACTSNMRYAHWGSGRLKDHASATMRSPRTSAVRERIRRESILFRMAQAISDTSIVLYSLMLFPACSSRVESRGLKEKILDEHSKE
jgi:hypothetical protein